jgi:hypothetical protein
MFGNSCAAERLAASQEVPAESGLRLRVGGSARSGQCSHLLGALRGCRSFSPVKLTPGNDSQEETHGFVAAKYPGTPPPPARRNIFM